MSNQVTVKVQDGNTLDWSVHTANLLKEILENNHTGIFLNPLRIFGELLYKVGERAAELNDPELNKLMIRLTIYEIADPHSERYNKEAVDTILNDNRR